MLHVFVLLLTLTGQPAELVEGSIAYTTDEDCKQAMPHVVDRVQEVLAGPANAQKFKVGGAACMTEEDAQKMWASNENPT